MVESKAAVVESFETIPAKGVGVAVGKITDLIITGVGVAIWTAGGSSVCSIGGGPGGVGVAFAPPQKLGEAQRAEPGRRRRIRQTRRFDFIGSKVSSLPSPVKKTPRIIG